MKVKTKTLLGLDLYHPPQSFELKKIEKDLFNIVNSIKLSN